MKRILMNKDVEVMTLEYDSISCSFTKIYNVSNMEYAPYIISRISNDNDALLKRVSRWFLGRGIPSWRDRLDFLLHRLNIIAPNELLNKAFGLLLSDHYWLKPFDTNIKYDDINFFDNGQSLNINYYSEDELHVTGEGIFFYEVRSFDEIIKVVKDIKRIDVSKLEGIPEWFDNLLRQYQEFTHISNERINKLCILLNHQINKLKKLIEE